jgi:hypothetical protein
MSKLRHIRENGRNYDGVLNGGRTRLHPRPAEPLPPTYCRLIEGGPLGAFTYYLKVPVDRLRGIRE